MTQLDSTLERSPALVEAADVEDLLKQTGDFFARHWSRELMGPPPEWHCWETFLHGSVPNYQHGGCYALFAGDELIYIGLGASRGGGRYVAHGVSRRLMAHVIRSDKARGPFASKLLENWAETTAIWTIGFPTGEYLAAALETYLIRELSPRRNSRV